MNIIIYVDNISIIFIYYDNSIDTINYIDNISNRFMYYNDKLMNTIIILIIYKLYSFIMLNS
jgi:hypothetical protein